VSRGSSSTIEESGGGEEQALVCSKNNVTNSCSNVLRLAPCVTCAAAALTK
jgi:hypothetical protein